MKTRGVGRLALVAALALSRAACADSQPVTVGGSGGAIAVPAGTGGAGTGGAGTGGMGSGGRTVTPGTGGMRAAGTGGAPAGTGGAGGGGIGGGGGPITGGPSLCAAGKFLICEDFESTAVGGVPSGWTKHGDAAVDADRAARGAHALKIAATTNGERRIYTDATKLGRSHWGRIFYEVQLPAPVPTGGGVIHSTMVALQGVGPRNGDSEYRVVDTVENSAGKHQFLWNVQPSSVAEFGKGSAYDWMYDGHWHCAEWHVDGGAQSYHFYIDGSEVTQIAIDNGAGNYSGTDIPDVFSQIRVGWYNYQAASPGFVAWIDEVAVDTGRIGCSN